MLITSFETWLPDQVTNSSDDLLQLLIDRAILPDRAHCLRRLPVDFDRAPPLVLQTIQQYRPRTVLLCGMAEGRSHLSLEAQAQHQGSCLATTVDLPTLIRHTQCSQISTDAGNFVCNWLYYRVLQWALLERYSGQVLFLHVPPLSDRNREPILADVRLILDRLESS
ncbi:MAG: peptidase C15 [Oscillatoriales cyanobacterium]|nr:MAG: peptidase C15 [Oscillatoriales cyanobacterium]